MREEEKLIEEVCKKIKEIGKIGEDEKQKLYEVFGKRFRNALKALDEEAIKKYVFKPSGRTVWIVVGKERDYEVIPLVGYCSCDDFYFRVMDGEVHLCYHLIAQKIAECLGWYDKIEESDELYDTLMNEWRKVTP